MYVYIHTYIGVYVCRECRYWITYRSQLLKEC